MRRKILITIAVSVLLVACCGCTKNSRTRTWGATNVVELEPGQKLVQVTWNEASLWYLTEPMEVGYEPKTMVFQEDSRLGVMEGKVVFREKR